MNKDPHTADKVLNSPREMTLDRTHAFTQCKRSWRLKSDQKNTFLSNHSFLTTVRQRRGRHIDRKCFQLGLPQNIFQDAAVFWYHTQPLSHTNTIKNIPATLNQVVLILTATYGYQTKRR